MIWDVLVPFLVILHSLIVKTYDNEKINGMSFKLNYAKTLMSTTVPLLLLQVIVSQKKTFRSFFSVY